ncbi:MAG: FAD:protein FMN transferase [Flavobacteriaceae bacterium]|nr:FAD:protein FMN transferase [Flavobacteriaceae bacterium]
MKKTNPFLLFVLLFFNNAIGQNLMRFSFSEVAMGTQLKIIFYASDSLKANDISHALFKKVKVLNAIFSDYDKNSELMQLCNTYETNKRVKVSNELFDILYQASKISIESDGLFDVTVGPYTKLWRKAKKNQKLPTKQQLLQAKKAVDYNYIVLNHKNKTITFKKYGVQIDLGGIAKGYTSDEVLKMLKNYNINQALIDFGGDITAGDPPPNKKGWNVELSYTNSLGRRISKTLLISNMSIATSGDYFQQFSMDNINYSHIIDPATGLGITKSIQVTVIAKSGTFADGFASAFSIMQENDIENILKKNKDLHVFITTINYDSTKTWDSELFNNYQLKN